MPVKRKSLEITPLPSSDVPNELGTYSVLGEVPGLVHSRLLIAHDRELERQVWIILDSPLSTEARREVWRPTRLAWLGGGTLDTRRWDAFLAPEGAPLRDLVDPRRPLAWAEARHVLRQLAEELSSACADETLPESLDVSQLWIRHGEQVQLLDVTPIANDATEGLEAPNEERALSLLRDATILALEGRFDLTKERSMNAATRSRRWIRARLPLHARPMVSRLWSSKRPFGHVDQFLAEINSVLPKPPRVTAAMRASRMVMLTPALLLLFLFTFLLSMMVVPSAAIKSLTDSIYRGGALRYALEQPYLRKKLLLAIAESESGPETIRAHQQVEQIRNQAGRQLNEARAELIRRLDATPNWQKHMILDFSEDEPDPRIAANRPRDLTFWHESASSISADFSIFARDSTQAASHETKFTSNDLVEAITQPPYEKLSTTGAAIGVCVLSLMVASALHITYAFLFAGGITYVASGMCLVRSSGRKAWRIQYALRAVILWIPVWTGCVTAALVHAYAYEQLWAVITCLSVISVFIIIYILLAIRFPTRSAVDYLVGTYLVPR
jgi:hypothetical protein